jgi:hypothetical protein
MMKKKKMREDKWKLRKEKKRKEKKKRKRDKIKNQKRQKKKIKKLKKKKKRPKLPTLFWPFVGPFLVFGLCGIVSNPGPFEPIVSFLFWLIVGSYYFGICGIL